MTVRSDTGPFVIVPEWLLDAGVSGRALKAYCVLAKHADKAGVCSPSRRRIGEMMGGASTDTVDRALDELKALSALSWVQRKDDAGDLTSSEYTLYRVPPGAGRNAATGGGADAAENQTHLEPELRSDDDEPDAATPSPKSRPVRIPLDFALDAPMAAWAVDNAPGVDPKRELDRFVDYWRGTGKAKADWPATWRNWMRKAQDEAPPVANGFAFGQPDNRPTYQPPPEPVDFEFFTDAKGNSYARKVEPLRADRELSS